MKIVVTGGMGKVGQYVVRELTSTHGSRMPHEVVVFDLIRGPEQGPMMYVGGDIRDLGQVVGVLAGADAVIDLAAIHRDGITPNDVTFQTNVLGAFNIHEAAWRLGIRRVVSTSSISVLGWDGRERDFLPEYLPIDEAHPLAPQDTYGLSKQLTEEIARSYTNKCGIETVVLRTPGVVSPEQLDAWRQTGRPAPGRFLLCSYIDGRDLATAYRQAVECPLPGHTLLFICADDSSVAEPLSTLFPRLLPELGEMASSLTGSTSSISNARAKSLLGWKPEHSWRNLTPD